VFDVAIGVADGEDEGGSESWLSVVVAAASAIAIRGAESAVCAIAAVTAIRCCRATALTASANTVSSRTYLPASSLPKSCYQKLSMITSAREVARVAQCA
jgi:hypothetical protein